MRKFFLLMLLLLCSGCGFGQMDKSVDFGAKTEHREMSYSQNKYPLTVVNLNSKAELEKQVYQQPPQKVIAVWQNSIEVLLALGLEDRIIAGLGVPSDQCISEQYRAAYNELPYKSLELLDLESTMFLEPDMLLGWYSTFSNNVLRGTDFWQQRGVHTYISKTSSSLLQKKTLEHEYEYILDIGKIFDREEKAQQIVKKMQSEISNVVEKTGSLQQRPTTLIIELLGNNISVYGKNTLAGDIVHKLKGDLLLSEAKTISMEQIIDAEPDSIFIVIVERDYGYEQLYLDKILKNKALQNLQCVREGKVYVLPLYAVYAPGIRAYDGIRIIANGLYPDLY